MDPVWWLVVGLVGSASLLGAGFHVGRQTLADDLRRAEEHLAARMEQIDNLLQQGEAGKAGAELVIRTERLIAARRGRQRWGLLLSRRPGPGTATAGGKAAGSSGRPGDVAVGRGAGSGA